MNYYVTEAGAAGDQTAIVLGGDLDMCATPAIRDALRRAIDEGLLHVTVDLGDAIFVDSTAIGVLLAASSRLRKRGRQLRLICTNRNVLRTIQIAGLGRHITVESLELQHAETRREGTRARPDGGDGRGARPVPGLHGHARPADQALHLVSMR